jgi:hypothetical protein
MSSSPGIGKNKWIKYNYGGHPSRVNILDNIVVNLTSGTDRLITFENACNEVAIDLYDFSKGKEIFVAMSGGCDSEIVAESFFKAGIAFTPVIVDIYFHSFHSNYADSWWAKKWCEEHSIKPVIKKITSTQVIADTYKISQEIMGRHLYPMLYVMLARQVKNNGGVFVSGQGIFEYYPDHTVEYLSSLLSDTTIKDNSEGWFFHECDSYIDIDCPGYHPYNFLSWTPEICLAYLNERNTQLSSELNKFKIMKRLPRPKLQGPDIVVYNMLEHQRMLRQTRGTSEVAFLGTHEELKKRLYNGR